MSPGECLLMETGRPRTGLFQSRTHLPDAVQDAWGHSADQRGIYAKNMLVPDGLEVRKRFQSAAWASPSGPAAPINMTSGFRPRTASRSTMGASCASPAKILSPPQSDI